MTCKVDLQCHSQVAYIDERLFSSLSIRLNKLVEIKTQKYTFLCHAFVDSFENETAVEITANIYKLTNSNFPLLQLEPPSSLVSLEQVPKSKATSLELELLVKETFHETFSWNKIQSFCHRILEGKVVSDGYVCDVRRNHHGRQLGLEGLRIESLNCSTKNGVVAKDTDISIKDITSTRLHHNTTTLVSPLVSKISSFITHSPHKLQSFLIWGSPGSGKMTVIESVAQNFRAQLMLLQIPLYSHSFHELTNKFDSLIKTAKFLRKKHMCFVVLDQTDHLTTHPEGRVALKHLQEQLQLLSGTFYNNLFFFATSEDPINCGLRLTHEVAAVARSSKINFSFENSINSFLNAKFFT